MRIPTRPREMATTLPEFADRPDAPVFVYRFPSPEEEADLMMGSVSELFANPGVLERLAGLSEEERADAVSDLMRSGDITLDSRYGRHLCRTFDSFLVRIESLEVGEPPEAFDRARHLQDIPAAWKLWVGREIVERTKSYMTELEEGNSSSPSSSAETTQVTASAAAGDAS